MKILRPGRKPAEWSLEVECTGNGDTGRGCGALLLAESADLFKTTDRGIVWFATILCPECGTMTDIERLGDRPTIIPIDAQAALLPRLAWEAAQHGRSAVALSHVDALV